MRLSALSGAPAIGGLDSRVIAAMRLVLSSSVLFIIGPADLEDLGAFHILSLLYTAYSAMLYVFARWQVQPLLSKLAYWADVGWAALLIAVSDDSIIAFLFLFPTLIAAFQWSFVAALRLTLCSAALLFAIGFSKEQGEELRLPEVLLPPIYLLVFGYLVACWGDREIASKRRLVLLKEITRLSNPRFGIDHTIGTMMERLRAFHGAEACLMIVTDPASNEYLLRRADCGNPERAIEAESIPAEAAQLLLAPPLEQAMIYFGAPHRWEWWSAEAIHYVYDTWEGRRIVPAPAMSEALITMVDAGSFISVPLHYFDSTTGRLYLTARRRRAFSPADVGFLLQVIEQVVPVIENIRLVDQLASSAAEEERRRLARDIHDNVIQPYIGFQIGLAAVSQKLQAGTGDIASDIAQLMTITEHGIVDLRHYMYQLPGAGRRESVLLAAVRRFVVTFAEATHIEVQVEVASDLYINDRLAAEVFQMVVEGLSNIRRHTHAARASIGLACQDAYLILRIANDDANGVEPTSFIPRSISERAAALGGQAHVERAIGGGAQVIIEIPL